MKPSLNRSIRADDDGNNRRRPINDIDGLGQHAYRFRIDAYLQPNAVASFGEPNHQQLPRQLSSVDAPGDTPPQRI